jgi:hypothetical protein
MKSVFEFKGHELEIHIQKIQGLGWCWAVSLEGRSLQNTMNEDGKISCNRAEANARQWIRKNA